MQFLGHYHKLSELQHAGMDSEAALALLPRTMDFRFPLVIVNPSNTT
jgi:hypothetical protein